MTFDVGGRCEFPILPNPQAVATLSAHDVDQMARELARKVTRPLWIVLVIAVPFYVLIASLAILLDGVQGLIDTSPMGILIVCIVLVRLWLVRNRVGLLGIPIAESYVYATRFDVDHADISVHDVAIFRIHFRQCKKVTFLKSVVIFRVAGAVTHLVPRGQVPVDAIAHIRSQGARVVGA